MEEHNISPQLIERLISTCPFKFDYLIAVTYYDIYVMNVTEQHEFFYDTDGKNKRTIKYIQEKANSISKELCSSPSIVFVPIDTIDHVLDFVKDIKLSGKVHEFYMNAISSNSVSSNN